MEEILSANSNLCKDATILKASVITTADFVVSGQFAGDIASSAKVFLEAGAVFEGSIIAQNVEVKGNFKGTIIVKDTATICKGATLCGTVDCKRIIIEDGATVFDATNTLSEKDLLNKSRKSKLYAELEKKMKAPAAPIKK